MNIDLQAIHNRATWYSTRYWAWAGRNFLAVTLLLMLLGLLVRLLHIGAESLYLDEAFSVYYGQQRLGLLLEAVARDTNPPLHFVLLKYWMEQVGKTEEVVRLLSALFSVLSIPLLMQFARRFFNLQAAVIGGLLFALSDVHLYYSQEARTYTLVSFLCLASFWFLYRLMEEGEWKHAWGLGAMNLLLIYAHYTAVYIFLLQLILVAFLIRDERGTILRYLAGQAAAALLFLPWALYFLASFSQPDTWNAPPDGEMIHFILLRFGGSEAMMYVFGGLLLLGIPWLAYGWYGTEMREVRKEIGLLLWGPGGFLLALLISATLVPAFQLNYVLFSSLGFILLVALIVSMVKIPEYARLLLVVVMGFVLLGNLHFNYRKESKWREAVTAVKVMEGPRALKLVSPSYDQLPMLYYYDFNTFVNYRHREKMKAEQDVVALNDGRGLQGVNLDTFGEVYLLTTRHWLNKPDYDVPPILERKMKVRDTLVYGDLRVLVYRK